MQCTFPPRSGQANELWAGLGYYRRAKFLLEGDPFIF